MVAETHALCERCRASWPEHVLEPHGFERCTHRQRRGRPFCWSSDGCHYHESHGGWLIWCGGKHEGDGDGR
jgi:phosphopantetheinyl transferase